MGLSLYTARFDSVPVVGCSPPSWAVWLACLEKGVRFEHRQLDYARGEHKSAEFLQKNPKGTLPALFDDGRLISETRPMLECIQRQQGPSLLGENQSQRALGIRQLNLAGQLKDAGMVWLTAKMQDQANAEEFESAYSAQLEALSRAFGESAFLAPACLDESRPGLADFLCFAYVATAVRLGKDVTEWPRLVRWLLIMQARPSVRSTRPAAWG